MGETKSARTWRPEYTPEQRLAVLQDYRSGLYKGRQIQEKYGIGHNTLYRWARTAGAVPTREHDVAHLKTEVARLRALVVELAMANKAMSQSEAAPG